MQISEARIRKLSQVGWTLAKIINEALECRWGANLSRVVGESVSLLESRFVALYEGVVWGAVRVINEVSQAIEGPFDAMIGLVEEVAEGVSGIESRIVALAIGLKEVVSEAVGIATSALADFGYSLVAIANDTLGVLTAASRWIRRVYTTTIKTNPFMRRRRTGRIRRG